VPPAILLAVLCLLAAASARAFTVGFFILEPHAMVVSGEVSGAAVEYLRDHIAPEMGESVEFVGPLPFPRLLEEFQEGRYDALLLLSRTPERAKIFSYPSTPYAVMVSGLLAPKGSLPDPVTSAAQLKGLRIGYTPAMRPGFMRDPSLAFDMVNAPSATLINFRKYREGRIDAVFNPDRNALLYRLRRTKGLKPSSVVTIAGTAEGMYTVFHPKLPRRFLEKYEKALEKVQQDLPYQLLLQQYMAH